jgi:hypothetical protein
VMNDMQKIKEAMAQACPLPLEVLLDPKYAHRYIDPDTGKLRSPEDIRENEAFWASARNAIHKPHYKETQ